MAELVTFGEGMLRYSPPGRSRLETSDTLEVSVAGAESNVAITAARLGIEATWLSKLPNSALGRQVTHFLHGHGVDTEIVWSDEGRQGTYYVEIGGKPRGTTVLYDRENAAVTTATPEELPTELLTEATFFVTSGITPALSPTLGDTTESLLSLAQSAGTRTVFDVNYRSKLWSPESAREQLSTLLPAVDLLVVAERDAETVLGASGDPETVTRALASEWDLSHVLLTRGSWGASALAGDAYHEQQSFETETFDPIGTGDAFVGGFLTELLNGGSVDSALEWGAATAALKRTIPGDIAVVTPDEVTDVITKAGQNIQR